MKVITIINGPNLNLTGKREQDKYGNIRFDDFLKNEIIPIAAKNDYEIDYFQSNHEGDIIDKIHDCEGKSHYIIINPGALTHYSFAIHDAIKAVSTDVIEVHISNIFNREKWREKSVISPVVKAIIIGFGLEGYKLALLYITGL
jgi:3-dehydroquinate dehydratase-2